MNLFFRNLSHLLGIVYLGQFFVCLTFNDTFTWSRWVSVEFHLVVWSVCLILSAVSWMYNRITKKK